MGRLTSMLQVNITLFPVKKVPLTSTETISAGSAYKGLQKFTQETKLRGYVILFINEAT